VDAATLHLMVGLPGTGKTTLARRLEADEGALRLTKDEWVKALHGPRNPTAEQAAIEGRLIEIGLRVLELGVDVVLDFGLWSRDERSALRQAAADPRTTARVHHLHLDPVEQSARIHRRQREAPGSTWPMSEDELAAWATAFEMPTPGELDGSEPVHDAPAPFASWDDWRAHRWPSHVPTDPSVDPSTDVMTHLRAD